MLFIFFKIDIFVGTFSGCENHEALASTIVSQCCTKLIGTIFTTTRKWVSKNKIRTRKISDECEQIVPPFYMIVTNMSEFMPEYHSKCFEIIFLRQPSIRSEYTAAKSRYPGTHVAYALMVLPFPLIKNKSGTSLKPARFAKSSKTSYTMGYWFLVSRTPLARFFP